MMYVFEHKDKFHSAFRLHVDMMLLFQYVLILDGEVHCDLIISK
jgi:hypothetical protein